jgi:hypothetical protein
MTATFAGALGDLLHDATDTMTAAANSPHNSRRFIPFTR